MSTYGMIYMPYINMSPVAIWQKPIQYYKAIKNKKKQKLITCLALNLRTLHNLTH